MTLSLAEYVLKFVNQTQKSIFLTGKAGTGKTTLLREITAGSHKNTVVVAPTGIAALNAGGVTIHSLFQLPPGAFIPNETDVPVFDFGFRVETRQSLMRHFRMNGVKQSVLRNMDLLIIDEVSMLRADLLDAMDFVLQRIRRNSKPFGGAQLLFIGDLFQLPPIVRNEEWQILKQYYNSEFFFDAQVIRNHPLIHIELDKIYRQTDDEFINILNNLRNNRVSEKDIFILNQKYKPGIKAPDGYITITTHNRDADIINERALEDIDAEEYIFPPEITDDFPEKIYPLEGDLKLKEGAQIMFIKNDLSFEKNFYNGKIGIVSSLDEKELKVSFPEEGKTITVEKYEWENIRFTVNEATKEVEEKVLGTYVQYPVKLAWAITVHKSQGLTFEKAVLDVSKIFAPGQAYVALSRLTGLNGLILSEKFPDFSIPNNVFVTEFSKTKSSKEYLESHLPEATKNYVAGQLMECFDLSMICQQWRNHRFSYKQELPGSPKNKFAPWMEDLSNRVYVLLEPSQKFLNQINQILSTADSDLIYLEERCNKAFDYFTETLFKAHHDLLLKTEEVQRIKRMKTYFNELYFLDEVTTEAVLKLMKSKAWVKIIKENLEPDKNILLTDELKQYKSKLLEQVKEDFQSTRLILEEDEATYYQHPLKKNKKKKKETTEETYELWKKYKTVTAIAEIRKLTESTIYRHMAKLVENGRVRAEEILGQDKTKEINEIINKFPDKNNTEIIELTQGKYTYEELRIFRAALF